MHKILGFACALVSVSVVACSGQKEVKSSDQADYNASASGEWQQPPPPLADAADAAAPAQPPAPEVEPPSAKPPVVEVIVDGVTRPVVDGEQFVIEEQRMLFFYSASATPDCSNVKVEGLVRRSLAGLCQVGFLPMEQGFKPGQTADATITVTTESGDEGAYVKRTFRVGVIKTN